ncbi:hypothetical protein CRG98_012722 [Punica granatum]|uniref:Uncharacterized protein n=1 Tax=Punica granatum TaxID=22663 RepID=A0A2I0KGA2_PUNGR|nr:hypothetical protein CRG98_012722 [Punica granatum]
MWKKLEDAIRIQGKDDRPAADDIFARTLGEDKGSYVSTLWGAKRSRFSIMKIAFESKKLSEEKVHILEKEMNQMKVKMHMLTTFIQTKCPHMNLDRLDETANEVRVTFTTPTGPPRADYQCQPHSEQILNEENNLSGYVDPEQILNGDDNHLSGSMDQVDDSLNPALEALAPLVRASTSKKRSESAQLDEGSRAMIEKLLPQVGQYQDSQSKTDGDTVFLNSLMHQGDLVARGTLITKDPSATVASVSLGKGFSATVEM